MNYTQVLAVAIYGSVQVVNHINALVNKPTAEEEDKQALAKLKEAQVQHESRPRKDAVVVQGVDNLMTHLARCCQPIPGDEIKGYITQGRGISYIGLIVSSLMNSTIMRQSVLLIRCGVVGLLVLMC